jgi:hypothetical protein
MKQTKRVSRPSFWQRSLEGTSLQMAALLSVKRPLNILKVLLYKPWGENGRGCFYVTAPPSSLSQTTAVLSTAQLGGHNSLSRILSTKWDSSCHLYVQYEPVWEPVLLSLTYCRILPQLNISPPYDVSTLRLSRNTGKSRVR